MNFLYALAEVGGLVAAVVLATLTIEYFYNRVRYVHDSGTDGTEPGDVSPISYEEDPVPQDKRWKAAEEAPPDTLRSQDSGPDSEVVAGN